MNKNKEIRLTAQTKTGRKFDVEAIVECSGETRATINGVKVSLEYDRVELSRKACQEILGVPLPEKNKSGGGIMKPIMKWACDNCKAIFLDPDSHKVCSESWSQNQNIMYPAEYEACCPVCESEEIYEIECCGSCGECGSDLHDGLCRECEEEEEEYNDTISRAKAGLQEGEEFVKDFTQNLKQIIMPKGAKNGIQCKPIRKELY